MTDVKDLPSKGWYVVVRDILVGLCRVIFRVRVFGKERVPPSGSYILAPSHRSILDIPFTAFVTRRRIRFMAKRELFKTKIARWIWEHFAAIEVDRGTSDRGALRATQLAIESGEPVGIFPEGTRRTGPVLCNLFDGVAYLALKTGAPIVPVGIGGSEAIMPRGKTIPRPRRVTVVVGSPICVPRATGTVKRTDVAALTERLRIELQSRFDEASMRA